MVNTPKKAPATRDFWNKAGGRYAGGNQPVAAVREADRRAGAGGSFPTTRPRPRPRTGRASPQVDAYSAGVEPRTRRVFESLGLRLTWKPLEEELTELRTGGKSPTIRSPVAVTCSLRRCFLLAAAASVRRETRSTEQSRRPRQGVGVRARLAVEKEPGTCAARSTAQGVTAVSGPDTGEPPIDVNACSSVRDGGTQRSANLRANGGASSSDPIRRPARESPRWSGDEIRDSIVASVVARLEQLLETGRRPRSYPADLGRRV